MMGAGMMRGVARAMLSLYPKAWRERYGEEVADLIAARPVRPRTVADLVGGAADAWLHHRRIPGARRQQVRMPLAVVLVAGIYSLWLPWNPGVSDPDGLRGVWARAAQTGSIADQMHRTATLFFAIAAVSALLTLWQLATATRAIRNNGSCSSATRATGRRATVTALVVAVPTGIVLSAYVNLSFMGVSHPVGPLGEAISGGFYVPTVMALVLPVPLIAAASPMMRAAVRAAGKSLAVAAIMNAIAWVAVAILVALGAAQASSAFVLGVAGGAMLSIGLTTLVARAVLRRSPAEPELSPIGA